MKEEEKWVSPLQIIAQYIYMKLKLMVFTGISTSVFRCAKKDMKLICRNFP